MIIAMVPRLFFDAPPRGVVVFFVLLFTGFFLLAMRFTKGSSSSELLSEDEEFQQFQLFVIKLNKINSFCSVL